MVTSNQKISQVEKLKAHTKEYTGERNLLTLYNSLTKRHEIFQPPKNRSVKMYTCGPSIYRLPHIGNYRTFIFEDILHRYLEYLGYSVERVLNITDVEDKAIAEAENENTTLTELTERNVKIFLEELKNLRVKTPDYVPRSSTSVDQAVRIIESLLKKGYAYWYKGNVYYDPLKFKGFGKLYGLDMSKWPKGKRRFHKDTYRGNRWNRGDFILWRGYRKGDKVYWNTKMGKGRPAWNVQDPAMLTQHLGFEVDICCGGVDNIIRHHDYVIAVIEGVSGKPFAHFWLHAAHLYVDGKKMSKSRGNIIYPSDLLKQRCQWDHIRFFLIYGHYRRRLNFTFATYTKICERLERLRQMVKNLSGHVATAQKSSARARKLLAKLTADFEENMSNDLHIEEAFNLLFNTVYRLVILKEKRKLSKKNSNEAIAKLRQIDQVLQVIF